MLKAIGERGGPKPLADGQEPNSAIPGEDGVVEQQTDSSDVL